MNTVEFLDAVKQRHGLTSDYALTKLLGWRVQRIYEYRHSARELDDEGCVQIAGALDLPPAYVMACVAAARAKDAAIKKHWQAAAKLLKTGTAAVILATVGALSQGAALPVHDASSTQSDNLYIMRRWRRRLAPGTRRRKVKTVITATANTCAA